MRSIAIFIISTLGIGWLGRWLDAATGQEPGAGIGVTMWLIGPLIVALALRFTLDQQSTTLGIAPRRGVLWHVLSAAIYPFSVVLVLAVGSSLGATRPTESWAVTAMAIASGALALLPAHLIKCATEEAAWRGYLAGKMIALGWRSIWGHTVVGMAWGLWHLPYLRFVVGYSAEDWVTLAPRFVLGCVAASIVYGEIRILTGSFWPAVIMHAIGGALIGSTMLDGSLWIASRATSTLSPVPEGWLMIGLFALIGAGIHAFRTRRRI